MLEAMGLFHRYRLRACKTPEFWTSDGGGAGTAVPFVCRLKLSLMEAGSTDKEANETPYALAVWHYLADLESKGRVDIVTDYDRECIEALRSMRGANGTP